MKFIDQTQNSDTWLQDRKNYIGGSDVSGITQTSLDNTPFKVWKDKKTPFVKEDKDKQWIFEKGHRYEEIARAKLEIDYGFSISPVVVKHESLPYCQVSLDGFNLDKKFQVEIKYMGKEDYENVKKKIIPEYYMDQVQYQLIATGFKRSLFCAINDDQEIEYFIIHEDQERMSSILKQVHRFYYEYIINNVQPPLTEIDELTPTDPAFLKLLETLKNTDDSIKRLNKQREANRSLILDAMPHNRVRTENMLLTVKVNKKGDKTLSVRYS